MNKRLAQLIVSTYLENEQRNAHSENFHYLALHLGDEEIIDQCEHALKTQRPEHVGHPYVIPVGTQRRLTDYYYELRNLVTEGQPKTYTVIQISLNTNTFGLRRAVLLAPDGTGKAILINYLSELQIGHDVAFVDGRLQTDHEYPTELKSCSSTTAPIIIKEAKNSVRTSPTCDCGEPDAYWAGDTLRTYACKSCHEA